MATIQYKNGKVESFCDFDEYTYDGKAIMFFTRNRVVFVVNFDTVASVLFTDENTPQSC